MELSGKQKHRLLDAASHPALATTLYGAAHLLVDLASIASLYTAARSGLFPPEWAAILILCYDCIAFASQLFIGFALDRLGLAGPAAAAGCLVTALGAWLVAPSPIAAVLVVAAGNALFHVGGGTVCLRLGRGRAALPGLFVAPGAIGLFLGKQLGGTALFLPWVLTLLLCVGACTGLFIAAPKRTGTPLFPEIKGFGWVVAALLVTVVARSLVGFSVFFPWATGWQQALWLTLAIFAGKALGGVLGDRLGWRNVTVTGLVLSAPLLALGTGTPITALAGLLCFNLTMAITLTSLAAMLPGYEGFAFGLTTTAIVTGLIPSVIPAWKPFLGSPVAVASMIALSAAALWFALGQLEKSAKLTGPQISNGGGFFNAGETTL